MESYGFFRDDASTGFVPATDRLGEMSDRERAAEYLEGSAILVYSMQLSAGLPEGCFATVELHVMTDGHWLWPKELSHYVRCHGYRLPDQFFQHVESLKFIPPLIDDDDLIVIAEQAKAILS